MARVGFGFGGGAGRGRKQGEIAQGGGGGGGASAAPAGYIQITDGNAVFKPIRDPLVDVVVPLATLAVTAFWIYRLDAAVMLALLFNSGASHAKLGPHAAPGLIRDSRSPGLVVDLRHR